MIKPDLDALDLLSKNVEMSKRQAEHLTYTRKHIPHPAELDDPDVLEKYEALTSRFARLQDLLIKPFRSIAFLEMEEERTERIPDLLNLMEKRGIIHSANDWVIMRRLRNAITHEYWDTKDEQKELLDSVYRYSETLQNTVKRLTDYADALKKRLLDEDPG